MEGRFEHCSEALLYVPELKQGWAIEKWQTSVWDLEAPDLGRLQESMGLTVIQLAKISSVRHSFRWVRDFNFPLFPKLLDSCHLQTLSPYLFELRLISHQKCQLQIEGWFYVKYFHMINYVCSGYCQYLHRNNKGCSQFVFHWMHFIMGLEKLMGEQSIVANN